jgi:hypothetical protein
MPEQYQIDLALAHLSVARYLISVADTRGMTHGEKHHLLCVALSELVKAIVDLGAEYSWLQDQDTNPKHIMLPIIPYARDLSDLRFEKG